MTDKTPATLDRLWHDIPTGPAPIADLLIAGHAAKRRRRRAVLAGTAAMTALIVGGGFVVAQSLPGSGDPGGGMLADAPSPHLKTQVRRQVSHDVAALFADAPLGRAAAVWDAQTRAVIYVSELAYSSSCPPGATASMTESGAVTLDVSDDDGGRLGRACTADATRYFVRIDGLGAAPQELTVTASGKTRVIPVSTGGVPTLNTGQDQSAAEPNDALAVGESGPMTLYLHCGLHYVAVGGELWETTPLGNGSTPDGWPERFTGTATRTAVDTIEFTSPRLMEPIVFHPGSPPDEFVCY